MLREKINAVLDKYAFTRGWPRGDTKMRDNATDQILSSIVLPEKSCARCGSENQEVYRAYSNGFNDAIDEMKRLNGLEPLSKTE